MGFFWGYRFISRGLGIFWGFLIPGIFGDEDFFRGRRYPTRNPPLAHDNHAELELSDEFHKKVTIKFSRKKYEIL